MDIEVGKLLILNLVYWYVPAVLTPIIFRLGHRFRLDGPRWLRALGVHACAAVSFSVVHCACLLGTRLMLWDGCQQAAGGAMDLRSSSVMFLAQLDWTLMTYAAIVGPQLRAALQQGVAGARGQGGAARDAARRGAAATLEAELHPHFLFNTLHAISTLVHTNPDGADRMISRLSDLLRLTFDRSGAPRVSLQEELEFLQKYLEIEQTRFQDRLSVNFDIDPETLDAEVPRLILQPLVENAIKHGVAPQAGAGLVQIATRRQGETLWIEVSDNGVGLSAGARARLRSGVGLSNTRDRLECLYGDGAPLEFSDGTQRPGGAACEIPLPARRPRRPSEAAFQVA